MKTCFEAKNEVTRVAYLEDPREPKLLFEFIEMNAVMRAGFSAAPRGGPRLARRGSRYRSSTLAADCKRS